MFIAWSNSALTTQLRGNVDKDETKRRMYLLSIVYKPKFYIHSVRHSLQIKRVDILGCHPSRISPPKVRDSKPYISRDLLNSNKIRATSISVDVNAFRFGRLAKGCFSPGGRT